MTYIPTYPAPSLRAASAPDRYRRACWFGLALRGYRAGLTLDDLERRPWRFAR